MLGRERERREAVGRGAQPNLVPFPLSFFDPCQALEYKMTFIYKIKEKKGIKY